MSVVYGYGRHSTLGQSLTEEAQKASVDAYTSAYLQRESVDSWLYDSAVSGGTPMFERPEGRKLWALAQPGDHIVVAKLDRAFRNTLDGLSIIEMLDAKGVFFHCVAAKVDTFTAQGRVVLTVLLGFAQFEREQAAERTREALAVKKNAGLPYGPHAPFGWRKVGSKRSSRWVPDQEERDQCHMIVGFRAAGYSWDRITEEMRRQVRTNGHLWNRHTVKKAHRAARKNFPKELLASVPPDEDDA
jgi:putative DNA-invertase from lambdoid prophage Rac